MGIIDKYIRRRIINPATRTLKTEIKRLQKDISNQKEKQAKVADLRGNSYAMGEPPARKAKEYLLEYKEWIYANVTATAEICSNIDLELYQLSASDEVKNVKRHAALEILNKVNPYMTKHELIFASMAYYMLLGEFFWYLVRKDDNPNSKPVEIWPLRPDWIDAVPGKIGENKFIDHFIYKTPNTGEGIRFETWEILHKKTFNPTNAYRGKGIVEAAATTIDIDNYSAWWNRNFFFNSAQPDAVLMTEHRLNDDEYNRIRANWVNKYGGVNKARQTAILEGGLKFEPIQSTMRDMQFLDQQKWTRDKINALFRNTKVILGITEDVNRANAEASEYVQMKYNIIPKMQSMTDFLNEFLLPIYDKTETLFFDFKDPLPENVEEKVKEYVAGHNRWLTTNEIRRKENLEDVEGGDSIYIPFNLAPIGDTNNQQSQPIKYIELKAPKGVKIKPKDYSSQIERLHNRNLKLKEATADFKKNLEKILKAKVMDLPRYKYRGLTLQEKKEKFWNNQVKIADNYEPRIIEKVQQVFDAIENEVIDKINNPKKGIDDYLYDTDEYVGMSINLLTPIIETLMMESGEEALSYLGLSGQVLRTSDNIRKYLNNHIMKFSKEYNKTAYNRLKRGLKEGMAAGESSAQLTKRVRDIFGSMDKFSAERIARTESIKAGNFGTLEGYRQSNVVTGKEWLTAFDERTCPYCEEMDGKVVELDDNYFDKGDTMSIDDKVMDFDYEAIETPPLHASCRCTLIPVIVNKSIKAKVKTDKKQIKEKSDKVDDLKNKMDEIAKMKSKIKAVK